MKKALISLTATVVILLAIIGSLVIAENRAKVALESDVSDYLRACDIEPNVIDVHGRPYLLYAAKHTADLTYVDVDPAAGTNKDQLLVHRLVDGHAGRLTRFITFDYPSSDATPVKNPDDSYTEVATIDGEDVTFSATTDADRTGSTPRDGDRPHGSRLDVLADGRKLSELSLPQPAEVENVSAGEDGVIVEVEYADVDCR